MGALTKYAETAEHQKAYVILARGVRVPIIHIRVCERVCLCVGCRQLYCI